MSADPQPAKHVPDGVEAGTLRGRLAKLFDLGSVHRQVTRVRVHGRGGKAWVRIDLDNGEWIELDPLGSYSTPAKMKFEISAQAGSKPRLDGDDVQEIVTLIFWLGEHYETIATADRAWELGADYLRAAVLCDVDMSDQASRWAAFEHLDRPDVRNKREAVLLDTTGRRYVRTQWIAAHLRVHSDPGEAGAMKTALERHGWRKPGTEGRIKATHPTLPRPPLIWAFLIVPEGWENRDPEPGQATAGDGSLRATRARLSITCRHPAPDNHRPRGPEPHEEDA